MTTKDRGRKRNEQHHRIRPKLLEDVQVNEPKKAFDEALRLRKIGAEILAERKGYSKAGQVHLEAKKHCISPARMGMARTRLPFVAFHVRLDDHPSHPDNV